MSDDRFIPKLGKPRDRGAAYGPRLRKAAAKAGKRGVRRAFSGALIGRGSAPARAAAFRRHPFAKFRMRRVIVKTHIARAKQGIGKAAFRAHVKYIQRDGVSREGEKTELYGADLDRVDEKRFLARSEDDRHQFRIILSPEDGDALGDLKENTRSFMARMEKDLGTTLDWVAVDHYNTGHPHTHIVIRGKDARGRDLIIAREYLTRGMRARAAELATERLGPRRDLDIARAQAREATADRWTGVDRAIAALEKDGLVRVNIARGAHDRFNRTLTIRRLRHLEGLRLASREGDRWRMERDWRDTLKTLGRRGDIIRTLSAASGRRFDRLSEFTGEKEIMGRVIGQGPGDELRDTRMLAVEATDGQVWAVAADGLPAGALPQDGAIIRAGAAPPKPRSSDRTIASVAAVHGGLYSDALHEADDPSSTRGFRTAHKRRLEALRRAGLVDRRADGTFVIPGDYLARAAQYEARSVRIDVLSWAAVETQIEAVAPVWLDDAKTPDGVGAFVKDIAAAKVKRVAFLKKAGLWAEGGFDPAQRETRIAEALAAAAQQHAQGRAYVALSASGSFDGVYQKPVDLPHGRFALLGRGREISLSPWRLEMERVRGRQITVRRTAKGAQWTLGKTRGPAR